MEIVVTGASGFIGRRLTEVLRREGHTVVPVRIRELASLPPSDAVVHLAGEPVAQSWTAAAQRRIRESRVEGTRRLVEALSRLPRRPAVLVSASAIGIYGNRGDQVLTEQSALAAGFLAEVCKDWEKAADGAGALGLRVVKLRIGVVLGRGGGALARMLPAFRMGAGGKLGPGRQWMSWIHIDDLAALIRFAIGEPSLSGPVNATSPNPITNAAFTRTLASALRRPAFAPVPAFVLRLMFGEMASVLLDSQRVLPKAAEAAGFRFRFPELAPALGDILA